MRIPAGGSGHQAQIQESRFSQHTPNAENLNRTQGIILFSSYQNNKHGFCSLNLLTGIEGPIVESPPRTDHFAASEKAGHAVNESWFILPEGKYLCCITESEFSEPATGYIFDLIDGKLLRKFLIPKNVIFLGINENNPPGEYWVGIGRAPELSSLRFFQSSDGQSIDPKSNHPSVLSALRNRVSADGKRLLMSDGTAHSLIDVQTGMSLLKLSTASYQLFRLDEVARNGSPVFGPGGHCLRLGFSRILIADPIDATE